MQNKSERPYTEIIDDNSAPVNTNQTEPAPESRNIPNIPPQENVQLSEATPDTDDMGTKFKDFIDLLIEHNVSSTKYLSNVLGDCVKPSTVTDTCTYLYNIKKYILKTDKPLVTFLQVLDTVADTSNKYKLYSLLVTRNDHITEIVSHELKNTKMRKYYSLTMDPAYAALLQNPDVLWIREDAGMRFTTAHKKRIESRLKTYFKRNTQKPEEAPSDQQLDGVEQPMHIEANPALSLEYLQVECSILTKRNVLIFSHFECILRIFTQYDEKTFDERMYLITECVILFSKKITQADFQTRFLGNVVTSLHKTLSQEAKKHVIDAIIAKIDTPHYQAINALQKGKTNTLAPEEVLLHHENNESPVHYPIIENPESGADVSMDIENAQAVTNSNNNPLLTNFIAFLENNNKVMDKKGKHPKQYLKRIFTEWIPFGTPEQIESATPEQIVDYFKQIKNGIKCSKNALDCFLNILNTVTHRGVYSLYSFLVTHDEDLLSIIEHEVTGTPLRKYIKIPMDPFFAELLTYNSTRIINSLNIKEELDKQKIIKRIYIPVKAINHDNPQIKDFINLLKKECVNKTKRHKQKNENSLSFLVTIFTKCIVPGTSEQILDYFKQIKDYIKQSEAPLDYLVSILNTLDDTSDIYTLYSVLVTPDDSLESIIEHELKRTPLGKYCKMPMDPFFVERIQPKSTEFIDSLGFTNEHAPRVIQRLGLFTPHNLIPGNDIQVFLSPEADKFITTLKNDHNDKHHISIEEQSRDNFLKRIFKQSINSNDPALITPYLIKIKQDIMGDNRALGNFLTLLKAVAEMSNRFKLYCILVTADDLMMDVIKREIEGKGVADYIDIAMTPSFVKLVMDTKNYKTYFSDKKLFGIRNQSKLSKRAQKQKTPTLPETMALKTVPSIHNQSSTPPPITFIQPIANPQLPQLAMAQSINQEEMEQLFIEATHEQIRTFIQLLNDSNSHNKGYLVEVLKGCIPKGNSQDIADHIQFIQNCIRKSKDPLFWFIEVLDAVKKIENRYAIYSLLVTQHDQIFKLVNHVISFGKYLKFVKIPMDPFYLNLVDDRMTEIQQGNSGKRFNTAHGSKISDRLEAQYRIKLNSFTLLLATEKKKNGYLGAVLNALPGCKNGYEQIINFIIHINKHISDKFEDYSRILTTAGLSPENRFTVLILLGAMPESVKEMVSMHLENRVIASYMDFLYTNGFKKMLQDHIADIEILLTEDDQKCLAALLEKFKAEEQVIRNVYPAENNQAVQRPQFAEKTPGKTPRNITFFEPFSDTANKYDETMSYKRRAVAQPDSGHPVGRDIVQPINQETETDMNLEINIQDENPPNNAPPPEQEENDDVFLQRMFQPQPVPRFNEDSEMGLFDDLLQEDSWQFNLQ